MKFELNDYHRNISDQEIIDDVIKTAKKLNTTTLTTDEYTLNGTYHSSTLIKRFGSWKKVLELCSLGVKGHNFKYTFTDFDLIQDLKRVADIYGKNSVTAKEYNVYGTYNSHTLIRHYGSWNKILELAHLEININRNLTNEEMFAEIERIWILLGRQPTTSDIKKGISKYSLYSYARRFGGWRDALQAFIDYINDTEIDKNNITIECQSLNCENTIEASTSKSHSTSRDINLRLRFIVMKRDHFKCCACGASPATNPSIELHIDHIIPWSKGGETTIDNLQTLCSECNIGKSDMILLHETEN